MSILATREATEGQDDTPGEGRVTSQPTAGWYCQPQDKDRNEKRLTDDNRVSREIHREAWVALLRVGVVPADLHVDPAVMTRSAIGSL